MNAPAVYVRARDGALYRNPILAFPEGFVCFAHDEPPELVLWISEKEARGQEPLKTDTVAVLRRVFGNGDECAADLASFRDARMELRAIPGTRPDQYHPARSCYFDVVARIPRPTEHEGSERHASRLRGQVVLDFPRGQLDARQLEIPGQSG